MTLRAAIFGFGSFFKGKEQFRDVDLLIVHEDSSALSCGLAIKCKKHLIEEIQGAHITMLSRNEEQQLNFIRSTEAMEIGVVSATTAHADLNHIVSILRANACPLIS
jgi:hypothetical protein